jgi:serine/threonine-protein kinase HipA
MARRKKSQLLQIYENGQKVGMLKKTSAGAISFQYSEDWIVSNKPPISMSLPIQEAEYSGPNVSAFFDNLLPDSSLIRRKIAERMNSQSDSAFDLLSAIGADCVGALQFVPEPLTAPKIKPIKGELITKNTIEKKLKNLESFPLGNDKENDFRISIAGAQEKTAFLRLNNNWYAPQGSTPTTHIFKPSMGMLHHGIDLTTSVENEWLCMEICRFFGLESANCELAKFGSQKCLVVERFDREWISKSKIRRIHQEDMCQALGYFSGSKYESDGGPGIAEIMEFLDASDERQKDRETFLKAQLVFYLLGATDGHAKNFSIFLTNTGFRMAPLYDVMSIFPALSSRQIEKKHAKLAMAIGKNRKYRLFDIHTRHFEQTAAQVGFSITDFREIMRWLKSRSSALTQAIRLPRSFPKEVSLPILEGIRHQAEKL